MRPPPDLIPFFLDDKEDGWTILKAFFRRDGEQAKIQAVEVATEPPPVYG